MTTSADHLPMLSVEDLSVRYGAKEAVRNLSFSVPVGSIFGLLGVNGAGKTSTLRVVLGLGPFAGGSVAVLGERPGALSALRAVGFAPEDSCPPEFVTVKEYLRFVVGVRGKSGADAAAEIDGVIADFELEPGKLVRQLSKGNRRRLILAQAFVGKPKLLVLDEPLNGLDPLAVIKLRERLVKFQASGGTVLFSSHVLSEVEKVCSHLLILHEGTKRFLGTREELLQRFSSVEKAFSDLVGGVVV